jgi:hypothetical protein
MTPRLAVQVVEQLAAAPDAAHAAGHYTSEKFRDRKPTYDRQNPQSTS